MRLSINLDDDLYAMARSHATAHRISLSKAVGALLRQRMLAHRSSSAPDSESSPAGFHLDLVTLLPVAQGRNARITQKDVQKAMDDEDLRHLEAGKFISPQS
jgi:hypothetical protein